MHLVGYLHEDDHDARSLEHEVQRQVRHVGIIMMTLAVYEIHSIM